MHKKFQGDQRLIAMSSIKCLNLSFPSLKLACMLRTYRKCDPTVGFSKFEFNNKLLVGVIFFKVTSSVT